MPQSSHWLRSLSGTAILLATVLTLSQQITHAQQAQPRRAGNAELQAAGTSSDEWLAYGLDAGEKRYSPLTQIDASNVAQLEPQWTFDIPGGSSNPPGGGNQEATPLMSKGVLYG